jgi:hypothetical protein
MTGIGVLQKQINLLPSGIRPLIGEESRAERDFSNETALGQGCSLSHILPDVDQSCSATAPC